MAIKLSFRDNSEHESGFHVYRSDAPMDPRNLPKPYKDLGRNSSVVIDEDFGGIFDQRRYYRVAAYVKGGNRSVSDEVHAGYDGKSPTLNLNFASLQYAVAQGIGLDLSPRAFSDLITFTRSTGGGRFNAQGQYEWLPANTPRIDYDPVTGECRGLLIEEQRTNLLRYSSDFASAAWVKYGAEVDSGPGLGTDATGPFLIREDTTTGAHYIRNSVTTTLQTYTGTVYAKAAGRTKFRISSNLGSIPSADFDLSTRTATNIGSSTGASIVSVGDGWYRCSVSRSVSAASEFFVVQLMDGNSVSYAGDGTSGIYIWGAQLEAGAFPTSLIHTEGAQVTRAADIATVNELSPWYNPEQGTLFVEYSRQWESSPTQSRVAYLSGADATKTLQIRVLGSGVAAGTIIDAGTNTADISSAVLPISSSRVALAWGAAGASMAANGLLSGVDGSVVIPQGLTTLWLGNSFGNTHLRGHIRVLRYFPRRLSDTELQAMTA